MEFKNSSPSSKPLIENNISKNKYLLVGCNILFKRLKNCVITKYITKKATWM